MPIFDDREKAFEGKYKYDQELQFKVQVRRSKLLGLWIAERLELTGADAEAYAKEVVVADFDKSGDAAILRKVLADLSARNIDLSEHRIAKKMEELTGEAQEQIMTG